MSVDRRRDGDRIYFGVRQQIPIIRGRRDGMMKPLAYDQFCWIEVANAKNLGGLARRKIAHEVWAPIAVADHADTDLFALHFAPAIRSFESNNFDECFSNEPLRPRQALRRRPAPVSILRFGPACPARYLAYR